MSATTESIVATSAVRKAGAAQAWVLILTMFLPILAIIALAPALPTLMDHFRDVPNAKTLVPLLVTVPALCIAIFGGIAGWLTDRFGRRKLILGAMLLYGCAGLAPFVLQSFQTVLAGRILLGIAEAFILTIGNALLADYYTKEEQHKWLMVQGIVGPFLGTLLLASSGQLAAMGWQWPFALYALTFPILLFGFIHLWEPERRAKEETVITGVPFPWKIVLLLCAVTLGTAIVYFVQVIQFSLVLREIGVRDQALIGRISGIASIAVPFGALIFKRNAKRTINFQLAMVFLLMGIGLLGIGLSRDYRLSAVMALFQQTAAGMTVPCLVAWALSSLPHEHRGRGMGLWSASFFIGQFVSPLMVSGLRGLTGGLLPAVATFGGICLVATVISLLLRRNTTEAQ
jgi:MFS family permease